MFIKNSSCKSNNGDIFKSFPTNSTFNLHCASMSCQDTTGLQKKQPLAPELMKPNVDSCVEQKKNIGLKLLQKWGYEHGKGLGKELQGINKPVQLSSTKGRCGLGFNGSEDESSKPAKINKSRPCKNETFTLGKFEKKEEKTSTCDREKIIKDSKFKHKKNVSHINTKILKCKVIDMTKPEPVVFNSYHGIGKCQPVLGKNLNLDNNFVSLQELQDNLSINPEKFDQTTVSNTPTANSQEEKFVPLETGNKSTGKTETDCINFSNNDLMKKLDDLFDGSCSITSTEVVKIFEVLQRQNCKEYDQIIWSKWLPQIQKITETWDCRIPENIISILELWSPLVPSWILNNFLDTVILTKLTAEVEEWNPLTDITPIHEWLHPWLPFMNDQMNTFIYPIIRRKFRSALDTWHPSDNTARIVLEPWSQVFKKHDMDTLLVQSILPKLKIALLQLIINPCKQNLEQWYWICDWSDLIPAAIMAKVLNEIFFPKWFQILSFWLNHLLNSMPNFEEVETWCNQWKGMFDKKLLAEPTIKNHFKEAFKVINNSILISQGFLPDSKKTNSSKVCLISQARLENLAMESSKGLSQSFKDIVQKKCAERSILFLPMPNRYYNSKQVFKVGNEKIYIEQGTLFIHRDDTTWLPIELYSLLKKAKTC